MKTNINPSEKLLLTVFSAPTRLGMGVFFLGALLALVGGCTRVSIQADGGAGEVPVYFSPLSTEQSAQYRLVADLERDYLMNFSAQSRFRLQKLMQDDIDYYHPDLIADVRVIMIQEWNNVLINAVTFGGARSRQMRISARFYQKKTD